jgi:hypothetical protein
MAYSAPELLLVGAAQNLVLLGSTTGDNAAGDCISERDDDAVSIAYDESGLW